MKAKKQDLLKSVMVSKSAGYDEYDCRASLNIDGYTIELPRKSFKTIDEAVSDIKERISEAIIKFKPNE